MAIHHGKVSLETQTIHVLSQASVVPLTQCNMKVFPACEPVPMVEVEVLFLRDTIVGMMLSVVARVPVGVIVAVLLLFVELSPTVEPDASKEKVQNIPWCII